MSMKSVGAKGIEDTRLASNKGTTLVEVMTAVFIYMIGLAALFSVLTQSSVAGKQAEYTYTAYNIAKNHLERLKVFSNNFTTLEEATETNTAINQNGVPDPSGSYRRSTTVEKDYLYPSNHNLAKVTVSVYYSFKGKQYAPTSVTAVLYGG